MRHTVLAYPFRPFFLSCAWAATLLVPLWILMVSGAIELSPALPALHWHQHEMLAGVLYSAIAGFVLTAVCAWTGTPPLRGTWLLALWLLWLLPRVALLLGLAPALSLVLDLVFLPVVAAIVTARVLPARQWRQLPLVALLLLLWGTDLGFHLSAEVRWLHATVLATALLILLVGGRITPAFSRNWLQRQGREAAGIAEFPGLERVTAISCLTLFVLHVVTMLWPAAVSPLAIAAVAAAAGLASLWRLATWRGWLVREEPLLWILHAGLLWVSVGLLLRGAAALGWVSNTVWLHALGSGAIGTMILGVMARVALGHTGRPLRPPAGMLTAFWLVLAAGLLRILTALNTLDWQLGVTLSSLAWSAAFGLFLWRYTRILCTPRVDGKPG